MALNWIFALKAVPWADVVQAAPHIVKGARRLFNSARQSQTSGPGPVEPDFASAGDSDSLHGRLIRVEAAVQNLDSEQQASADLIRSLAEQNARMIEAMEVLRQRQRVLVVVVACLMIGAIVTVVWMVSR